MATRKTSASTSIDPRQVVAIALKQCKTKADYNRVATANTEADLHAAWNTLTHEEQSRIHYICETTPQPDLQTIADELVACGTRIQLQAVKAEHGPDVVKQAWKLIPAGERTRLTQVCQTEQTPEEAKSEKFADLADTPAQPIEAQPVPVEASPVRQPQPRTRTLFTIGDDLEKLNELLDDCGDDTQQQELISQWFEHLGDERDQKLDNYCGLIAEMASRAEVRKSEAKRLMELATADENRMRLLKEKLKTFFEQHNIKTVQTLRHHLSLVKNGGKLPLILDEAVPATQLPEHFQRVSIDPDVVAIREALERGETLEFAHLGQRTTSIRIK